MDEDIVLDEIRGLSKKIDAINRALFGDPESIDSRGFIGTISDMRAQMSIIQTEIGALKFKIQELQLKIGVWGMVKSVIPVVIVLGIGIALWLFRGH